MAKAIGKLSDEELLEACRKDDLKAYNELFRRYAPKLYKQAGRYIRDPEIAEELMMDLLFDLWEKRHERRVEGNVAAYLYRYMRNLIADQLRARIPDTIQVDTLPEDTLVDRRQADHGLATEDMEQLYQAILQELSPQRRRVFQLSREENLTYAEIARELGLSINTVENYMVAALNAFRNGTKDYITIATIILYLTPLAHACRVCF